MIKDGGKRAMRLVVVFIALPAQVCLTRYIDPGSHLFPFYASVSAGLSIAVVIKFRYRNKYKEQRQLIIQLIRGHGRKGVSLVKLWRSIGGEVGEIALEGLVRKYHDDIERLEATGDTTGIRWRKAEHKVRLVIEFRFLVWDRLKALVLPSEAKLGE
jgi:hypothetical protein